MIVTRSFQTVPSFLNGWSDHVGPVRPSRIMDVLLPAVDHIIAMAAMAMPTMLLFGSAHRMVKKWQWVIIEVFHPVIIEVFHPIIGESMIETFPESSQYNGTIWECLIFFWGTP